MGRKLNCVLTEPIMDMKGQPISDLLHVFTCSKGVSTSPHKKGYPMTPCASDSKLETVQFLVQEREGFLKSGCKLMKGVSKRQQKGKLSKGAVLSRFEMLETSNFLLFPYFKQFDGFCKEFI